MCAADCHAEHRRQGCRHRSPPHSHSHRKHQYIVKHNIKQTAAECRRHRRCRRTVISDKGITNVVPHKKRRKHHKNTRVVFSDCDNPVISAKKRHHFPRHKYSDSDKNQTDHKRPEQRIGEICLGTPVIPRPENFKPDCRTDSHHGTNGKNQAIHGKHQVERRNAVRPLCHGYKKRVRQNIHRYPQHAQNILGHIFCKKFFFRHLYSSTDIALEYSTDPDMSSTIPILLNCYRNCIYILSNTCENWKNMVNFKETNGR